MDDYHTTFNPLKIEKLPPKPKVDLNKKQIYFWIFVASIHQTTSSP